MATKTTKTATNKSKAKKTATRKPRAVKKSREQIEYERLNVLYAKIPSNKRELVEGLIWQAARLRVSLDDLWDDLQKNGNTEMFKQKNDGVEFPRERPESKIFANRDKNYLAIIRKLDELLPAQDNRVDFEL